MILKILALMAATYLIIHETPQQVTYKTLPTQHTQKTELSELKIPLRHQLTPPSNIKRWWHKEQNGIKRYPATYETSLKSKVRSIPAHKIPFIAKLRTSSPMQVLLFYEIKEENTGSTIYIETLVDRRNGLVLAKFTHNELIPQTSSKNSYPNL